AFDESPVRSVRRQFGMVVAEVRAPPSIQYREFRMSATLSLQMRQHLALTPSLKQSLRLLHLSSL
ncbi:hypothetical protein AAHH78_41145, partial [Burkholderia pseudomallei]